MLTVQDELGLRVLGEIRMSEYLIAVDLEQLRRRCTIASQLRLAERYAQIQLGGYIYFL